MINKIKCWIVILVMMCAFVMYGNSMPSAAQEIHEEAGVSAETANHAETGQEGTSQNEVTSSNPLLLDNTNLYSGMKTAYKNGYSPMVSKDQVEIVLPVYFENASATTSIRAVLDLGATENSPFVYKNYSKTVEKSREKVNNSKKEKEVFLIKFKLGLKDNRINGVYPVVIKVSYSEGEAEVLQEFPVYVNITDGNESSGSNVTAGEAETRPTSEPKLIVIKNKLSADKILSGSDFTAMVTLKNTNKAKYIQNITITVSCETTGISLESDSNVFYFDKLEADDTMELPLKFVVDESVSEGKYKVKLLFSYDNPEASSFTSEGEFNFQVYQNMRVGFEVGEMVSEINAGDSVSVPVQVMNLGRSTVYNVRCNVEGTGLSASKSLFVGNLEAGTAGSGELVLFAGMVNPDAKEEAYRYGDAYGKVIMTYEDAEGNSYTEEKEYYTNILPMKIESNKDETIQAEISIRSQLIVGATTIIILVIIGVLMAAVVHFRNKKIQEEQESP